MYGLRSSDDSSDDSNDDGDDDSFNHRAPSEVRVSSMRIVCAAVALAAQWKVYQVEQEAHEAQQAQQAHQAFVKTWLPPFNPSTFQPFNLLRLRLSLVLCNSLYCDYCPCIVCILVQVASRKVNLNG